MHNFYIDTDSANPAPFELFCPVCGNQHIDRDEWATKHHKTHLCEWCLNEWRPFPFATVGVDYEQK